MKIQAKDCAQGGVFQMEPRARRWAMTRIVHTLAQADDPALAPFFFDNPNFRAVVGQFLGDDCTSVVTGPPSRFCVEGRERVNIANDFSPNFVARDSAQVAERVHQPACNTARPVTPSVEHCGRVSIWDVASGGRMGFVTGEDAVELANSADGLCAGLPGTEPGPRPARRARLPVPGARRQPTDAADLLRAATSARPLPPSPRSAPVVRAARLRTAVVAPSRPPHGGGPRPAPHAPRAVRYQVRAVRLDARGKVLGVKTSARLGSSARSHKMVLRSGAYRFQVRATTSRCQCLVRTLQQGPRPLSRPDCTASAATLSRRAHPPPGCARRLLAPGVGSTRARGRY